MNIKGSPHLTLGERIAILELLIQNKSLNEIAEQLIKMQELFLKKLKELEHKK